MFGEILGGIAGSILGGIFGDERDEDARTLAREQSGMSADQFNRSEVFARQQLADNQAWAREQLSRNEQLQREFATHGIQWKMADAAAAGLHPVYGAGLGGAAYASNPVVVNPVVTPSPSQQVSPVYSRSSADFQGMGQGIGRLIEALIKKDAVKDAALAAAVDSNAAVTNQAASSMGVIAPQAFTPGGEMEWAPRVFVPPSTLNALDTRTYVADEVPSVRSDEPSVTAGSPRAAWSQYDVGGMKMDLPSKDVSEPLEAMSEGFWISVAVITHNINKYGVGWLRQFAEKVIPGYGPAINWLSNHITEFDPVVREKIMAVQGMPRRSRPTQRVQGVIRPPSGW